MRKRLSVTLLGNVEKWGDLQVSSQIFYLQNLSFYFISNPLSFCNIEDEYHNNLQSIAEEENRTYGAIVTFEEYLNADHFDRFVTLNEIKEDNALDKKRNTDNFLNSDVINKFKNDNFLNSLYLTHMKSKSLWKPDKFKLADRLVNSIKLTK